MNKSISIMLVLILILNLSKGQDYRNKVFNLETGEVKTYKMTPDSFPSTLSDHVIVDYLTTQSDVELLSKILGEWIYNSTISHKGDTITTIEMSFKEFKFMADKRFIAISQNSDDKIQGNYELDNKLKRLKLNFDTPFDGLKGSHLGKYLSEDQKNSFIYTNLIFRIKVISDIDLIFISANSIGNHNGEIFDEVIFNTYKRK